MFELLFSTRRGRQRSLLMIGLVQIMVVAVVFTMAWNAWSARREAIVVHAQERISIQGRLLAAIHTAMLNNLASLTEHLEQFDFSAPLSSRDRHIAESSLTSFLLSGYTYNESLILAADGTELIHVVRDSSGLIHHKAGTPAGRYIDPSTISVSALASGNYDLLPLPPMEGVEDIYSYRIILPFYSEDSTVTGFLVIKNQFGLLANWLLGVNQLSKGREFLLNEQGDYLLIHTLPDDTLFWQEGRFYNQFPEEWNRLAAGQESQILTENGLFTSQPIVWSGDSIFRKWASDTVHTMGWLLVQQIPRPVLSHELWHTLKPLLIAGVLADLAGCLLLLAFLSVRAQRALVQQRVYELNKALTSIIEGAPLAMIVLDRRGSVIHWNRAAETIFGWSKEEILGQFNPLVEEETRVEFEDIFGKTLVSQEPVEADIIRRHKDGSKLELHLWSTPIAFIENRPSAILGVLADVSHQHREQEAISRAERMETARLMARTVAHEFRQPLAALTILAELLELRDYSKASAEDSLKRIPKLVNRMDQLVNRLLNLTDLQDKTYWRDISILDLNEGLSKADEPFNGESSVETPHH